MKRLLVLVLFLAMAGDARLFSQRQGGPAPQGRQGGAAPAGGRQGGSARPARDRAPLEGTAVIRGRVMAADGGTPIRRAEVQAALGGQRARVALTGADGRYELRDLPAGSITIRASKTGFVAQQFGQRSAFAAAEPVALADGQQFTADFVLQRGGVITGRVFDDLGDPVANARVSALRTQFTPTGRRMVSAGGGLGITDDTGAYRLYGLAPGTYYVSATPQTVSASGPMVVMATGTVIYSATYFPGTTDIASAERVAIGGGQEQHNIDFALMMTPTVRVSGTVVTSNGAPLQAMVNLQGAVLNDVAGGERRSVGTAADGSFTLPSVAPGNYVLEVTGRVTSPNVPPEVAAVPIIVGSSDLTGVGITTSRGATVTGTLATDNGARLDMTGIRVSAPPARTSPGGFTPRTQVTSNATFELEGLVGAHTLRFDQLPPGWIVKSVTARGIDVTDVPLDFRGTEQASLRVVLTSRITQLAGTVHSTTSARGAGVVVFPDDESKWTVTSRYVRTARADDQGRFTIRALPGSQRYLAVALDYLEGGEHLDPDFLGRLRPLATSVSLDEGEQRQLDLSLQPRP